MLTHQSLKAMSLILYNEEKSLAVLLHRLDDGCDGGEVGRRSSVLAPHPVTDTLGKLEGFLAVWPCVLVTQLLEQTEMLLQAVLDGVEVLEGTHHRVIVLLLSRHLAHAKHLVGRCRLEAWSLEVLVRLHHHHLSAPLASLGDTEEVGGAYHVLSPSRLKHRLGGDEGRGYLVIDVLGSGVHLLRKL